MSLPTDRVVVWSANLRDLGGVSTEDGRTVRRGFLFRSGYLSELSDDETATVLGLGLKTVVDLRRPAEVEMRPSPAHLAESFVYESTSADDNDFAVIAANLADPTMAGRAAAMATGHYRGIVTDRLGPYRPVFARLTDPDSWPALFHCTAGKDRTGFVGAVLLRLLGVAEATVVDDYALTNEVRRQWLEPRLADHRVALATARGKSVDELTDADMGASNAILYAWPDYIRASLEAVTDRFGSWDRFRSEGLGIDDDRFARFRDALLA